MKVNWELHPWQCEASTTQLLPLSAGFAGNPIFSNIFAFFFRETIRSQEKKIEAKIAAVSLLLLLFFNNSRVFFFFGFGFQGKEGEEWA